EKWFLAFAAATLSGHLAQSSAARRIKGSNSKFASRERAPFIAVEGKQLTSLVREDRCELVRPLAAAPHRARHDADRSHGAWHCGESRRSPLSDRSARYRPVPRPAP